MVVNRRSSPQRPQPGSSAARQDLALDEIHGRASRVGGGDRDDDLVAFDGDVAEDANVVNGQHGYLRIDHRLNTGRTRSLVDVATSPLQTGIRALHPLHLPQQVAQMLGMESGSAA